MSVNSPDADVTPELIEALRTRGLVIVPIEPTAEMLEAGFWSTSGEDVTYTWEAMLQTAPSPLEAGKPGA